MGAVNVSYEDRTNCFKEQNRIDHLEVFTGCNCWKSVRVAIAHITGRLWKGSSVAPVVSNSRCDE